MAINVPQVQAKVAAFRAPDYKTSNVLGAMAEGRAQYAKRQQADIDDALQSSLGGRAMAGSAAALEEIALMPGGGAEAAAALQGVVASNNKAASDAASAEILNRGRIFAAIRAEPDEKKRRKLAQKYAINSLPTDGREAAESAMKDANNPNIDMMDAELEYGINLAAASDKYLQGVQDQIYGDTVKIREKNLQGITSSQKGLSTRIDNIETAYDKVDSLVDAAKGIGEPKSEQYPDGKPNRTAISSVLVGLVKLQDPNSAVLMAEMEGAINEQDPLAAITKLLLGKGTSQETIDAVLAKVDPLNPDNIDPAAIRSTASALVKANIRPMQMAYQDNLIKSKNLSRQGARSSMAGNFGQRLFDLNNKFLTATDDQNSQRLTYNEINQQRADVGLEPLTIPPMRTFWVDDGTGKMQGLTEKQFYRKQELEAKK